MLGNFRANTMLVAKDMDRARAFYTDILGLKPLPGDDYIAMFEAGEGSRIIIYPREDGSKAIHTVLSFDVKNLAQLLKDLKAKGVEQDLDNLPGEPDANGILHWGPVSSAWIKDSEGNIIGLFEEHEGVEAAPKS
jgi:catechol 2,3-dioxygenase-like lactoylglutathione lyase family enzyme